MKARSTKSPSPCSNWWRQEAAQGTRQPYDRARLCHKSLTFQGEAHCSKTKPKPGFSGPFVDSPRAAGFTLLGLWGALWNTGLEPHPPEKPDRGAHAMMQIFLSYARDNDPSAIRNRTPIRP